MDTKVEVIAKPGLSQYQLAIPALAFFIPLFVSGPQPLTGTVVNCLLFLNVIYSSKRNQGIIAVVPSVGALLNGILFGKFTVYLAYFLPFIWISNIILMNSFSSLKVKNSVLRVLSSAFLKALFLFTFAFIFFKAGLVPKIFLTAMGIVQFGTALMGGILALALVKFIKKP